MALSSSTRLVTTLMMDSGLLFTMLATSVTVDWSWGAKGGRGSWVAQWIGTPIAMLEKEVTMLTVAMGPFGDSDSDAGGGDGDDVDTDQIHGFDEDGDDDENNDYDDGNVDDDHGDDDDGDDTDLAKATNATKLSQSL